MSRRDPPAISHTTASEILKQTSSVFYSNLLTFIFLASLLLAFRSNVHTASHYLSSLIDADPSLKSILSRLDLSAGTHLTHTVPHNPYGHRRRRAFLHISRVGTLYDDFFSGDSDFDSSLFHPSSKHLKHNSTYLLSNFKPDSGFSDSVVDHGIYFAETVKPRVFGFKTELINNNTVQDEEGMEVTESGSRENTQVFNLEFLLKGLELGNRDATSLFFFIGVMSAIYAYIVFGFIVTYTWVSGVTFLKVVDHLLGNYRSFIRLFWDGSVIGLRRLSGFTLMRWAVRDAMAQVMGILFFGEIENQYVFFKIFLRLKFMPFANLVPWVVGHEIESSCFIIIWFMIDLILGFIFAVDSWVAIVESRRGGRQILTEGFHLLLVMLVPALKLRLLEGIVCGWFGRWILRRVFGHFTALMIQSLMEVYFLVAWLVFYIAAKHKDDTSNLGRSFGRRELEGLLEAAR